jgi:aminoglycoside 2''-phosphotransferase
VAHHFAPVRTARLDLGYRPVLIHGDLAQYHILFRAETLGLTGILDFGTASLGDPAGDFALIISTYGERFLQRRARTYPAIIEALDRARFLAGTVELQWALAGLRSGNRAWFVAHVGRARDAGPIGSPWPPRRALEPEGPRGRPVAVPQRPTLNSGVSSRADHIRPKTSVSG